MDDIVKDFLIESRENLDRLDQELVSLESDPNSKETNAACWMGTKSCGTHNRCVLRRIVCNVMETLWGRRTHLDTQRKA